VRNKSLIATIGALWKEKCGARPSKTGHPAQQKASHVTTGKRTQECDGKRRKFNRAVSSVHWDHGRNVRTTQAHNPFVQVRLLSLLGYFLMFSSFCLVL